MPDLLLKPEAIYGGECGANSPRKAGGYAALTFAFINQLSYF